MFATALISITLFEAVIIILLFYMAFKALRERIRFHGSLLVPLVLHAMVVVSSTLLFHPSQLGKAIERGVFLLAYPFGGFLKADSRALLVFNYFLVLAGLLFLPLTIYKFYKTGQPAMLWGGWFEVGTFYSIFAVASFSLFLYHRRLLYLLILVLFVGTVFMTMRRSAILGLAFALLAFVFLLGKKASKKTLLAVVFILLTGFVLSSLLLVRIDFRYATLYEVLTSQRSLNEEALDLILSGRWQIAKAGIEVVKRDLQEGNWLELLIGHGVNSGFYLEPKSPVGGIYESVLPLSEFIEKGLLGLLGVLWVYVAYAKFLLKFRIQGKEDCLLMPLLLSLGIHLVGAVFTFFWDAMLPLFLIMFNLVERLRLAPPSGEPYQPAR
ncbi:MAG: O-antigen ligase family protein [Aquificaceae bacterium]|nr:O-antigen ligase family protein [Aquificaceae bacterium]